MSSDKKVVGLLNHRNSKHHECDDDRRSECSSEEKRSECSWEKKKECGWEKKKECHDDKEKKKECHDDKEKKKECHRRKKAVRQEIIPFEFKVWLFKDIDSTSTQTVILSLGNIPDCVSIHVPPTYWVPIKQILVNPQSLLHQFNYQDLDLNQTYVYADEVMSAGQSAGEFFYSIEGDEKTFLHTTYTCNITPGATVTYGETIQFIKLSQPGKNKAPFVQVKILTGSATQNQTDVVITNGDIIAYKQVE